MRTFVLALALLAWCRYAFADPDSDVAPKSEQLALGLSIGGSVIGPLLVTLAVESESNENPLGAASIPMMITGGVAIVVGPSLGNWYAGRGWSAGLTWRLVGTGVVGLGFAGIARDLFDPNQNPWDVVPVVLGAGMIVLGSVLDIRESVVATRAYNKAHHGTLAIAPLAGRVTGLAVVGSF